MVKKRSSNFTAKAQHQKRQAQKDYVQKKSDKTQNKNVNLIKRVDDQPIRPLKQTYQEIKNRITPEIMIEMLNILRTSVNLGTFYQRWVQAHDGRILVVLGLIDEQTKKQLDYLDKHNLMDIATSTSYQDTFNQQYYDRLKNETEQALSELPLQSVAEKETDAIYHYPNIYMVSDKNTYQRLLEWSLPFAINLIYTQKDINTFINDKKDKVVIINADLSGIFEENGNQKRDCMIKLNSYMENHNINKIFIFQEGENELNKTYLAIPNREKLIKVIKNINRK